VSVHVAPDDERSTVNWPALGAATGTLVLLMAVERLAAVAEALVRHGRAGSTPVSVIANGTLPTQRTIVATLDTVAPRVFKEGIRPPAVVVIGEVVNVAAEIAELMRGMQPAMPGDAGAPPQAVSRRGGQGSSRQAVPRRGGQAGSSSQAVPRRGGQGGSSPRAGTAGG
jgi:hypothetical protein